MNQLDTIATARRCRELASECVHLMPTTAEDQRPVLLEMAEYWTKLADKAERGENVDEEISLAPIAEQLKAKK